MEVALKKQTAMVLFEENIIHSNSANLALFELRDCLIPLPPSNMRYDTYCTF